MYRKPAVDSGLSVQSLGLNSARGTQDQPADSSAAQSGSQSARASPAPSRASPVSSPGTTPRESNLKPSTTALKQSPSTLSAAAPAAAATPASLSPYNAMLPGGKRQSIMLNNRRASVVAGGRKSLFGAQIKALPGMCWLPCRMARRDVASGHSRMHGMLHVPLHTQKQEFLFCMMWFEQPFVCYTWSLESLMSRNECDRVPWPAYSTQAAAIHTGCQRFCNWCCASAKACRIQFWLA